MKELKPIEETWNKKRVFLGLIILAALIAGLAVFKVLVLDKSQSMPEIQTTSNSSAVKGISTIGSPSDQSNSPVSSPDVSSSLQDQIDTLKQEVSNLNLTDVATSSPQVQKVLNDIKSLQSLPRDQAKSACEQICNGL